MVKKARLSMKLQAPSTAGLGIRPLPIGFGALALAQAELIPSFDEKWKGSSLALRCLH